MKDVVKQILEGVLPLLGVGVAVVLLTVVVLGLMLYPMVFGICGFLAVAYSLGGIVREAKLKETK